MRWFLGIIGVIVVLGFVGYGFINNVRNTSIDYETRLSAQYLSNQNNLSEYISSFYEQLGVADRKSERMDEILQNAVKGRYDDEGFGSGGGFFNAIAEAYPDLAGLDIYDKVVDHVSAGRGSYRAVQDKLLDMLRGYDVWRQQGLFRSWVVRSVVGVPTDRLEAKVGDNVWRGEDAREKMYDIVLASDAVKAYDTGTMEPLLGKPE